MASTVTAMPSTRVSEAEWQTRIDLAACYRLVDLFGRSDMINTRITARSGDIAICSSRSPASLPFRR
jgi:hypothetical protein